MTRLRSHRSTSAPPGSASTAWAVASAASTRPEAAADPVIARTTSGNASMDALKPISALPWLTHSRVKLAPMN